MVGEGCCPQCPAVKRGLTKLSCRQMGPAQSPLNVKWCFSPCPFCAGWHKGWAWFVGLAEPITFLPSFRLEVQQNGAQPLPSMSVGSGWHIPGGWPESPVVEPCGSAGAHLPLHSHWLYLKGLCKNPVKSGVKTQLQHGSQSPQPQ